MAKSLVEKYEQILSQDPASTVFVELAKALIEKGDNARAVEVCRGGLEHHADSVVGRVLWGKALINLGRPAEAMEQFDQAIGIDRDNPHAYNLIGEVLLHKGLYRSALPLLRKAVALQPNDGRVRQWLEQTQAALAGGPAPVLRDSTEVDTQVLPASAPPGDDQTDTERIAAAPAEDQTDTERITPAPPEDAPTLSQPAAPSAAVSERREIPMLRPAAATASGREIPVLTPAARPGEQDIPVLTPAQPPPEPDPFAAVPRRTDSGEVMAGLTATFDALSVDPEARRPEDPFDAVARRSPAPRDDGERGATVPLSVPSAPPPPEMTQEPSVAVSQELYRDGRIEQHDPASSGVLGELPPPDPDDEIATSRTVLPAPVPFSAPAKRGHGLLEDIPELPDLGDSSASLEVPRVEVSSTTVEAIAREYERELREKLTQSKAKKSFIARHWLKLAAGGVLVLAMVVGALIYVRTLSVNQGSLQDALAEARKAISQDTGASYAAALEALDRARRMDDAVAELWALEAYARGLLYAEHGAKAEDRQQGLQALSHPGVAADFPALALAAQYYLAQPQERVDKGKDVIASPLSQAPVTELAGRLLLAKGDSRAALARFQAALQDQPANVRVLTALGDYYRASDDYPKALEFYGTAKDLSPRHPARVLGAAESRLELGQELSASLTELEALPADDQLPEELQWRKALVRGRLQTATGAPEKAIPVLAEGLKRFKARAFEFQLALGDAYRRAGRMAEAEDAFEAALQAKPHSEDAREALVRVLVDRDRAKEALDRVDADPESRRVSLARGVAWAKLSDWKRARGEFARASVKGRYPPEAVIYLALADAADGETKKAQQVLEKTLAVTKKARSEVLVALGDLLLQQGEVDKAKARYEEAAKEPDDVEGACAYGRLLLKSGQPEQALAPLDRAVKANDSHSEAWEALVRAQLQTGRLNEALDSVARWKEATDKVPASYRLSALALFQAGKVKEADREASLALRYDNDNVDAWRLRAAINFAEGDSKGGFRDLERANKLDPKDAATFCEIGHAFLRQGNVANAQAAFAAAVREDRDSSCGQVGAIYARLPSASRSSVRELERLEKGAPAVWDKAFAAATRSRVLLATGRAKDAKETAEAAVKLAPWSAPAQYALALALQKSRDPATGDAFARAVALDPANGAIRLDRADYLARGSDEDQAKALDEYERFLHIGGGEGDVARVKKALSALKKRLASR